MNPGTSYKHYLSPEHNPLRNVTHKRNNEDLLHAKSTKNGIKLCKVTVFIAWTLPRLQVNCFGGFCAVKPWSNSPFNHVHQLINYHIEDGILGS